MRKKFTILDNLCERHEIKEDKTKNKEKIKSKDSNKYSKHNRKNNK